MVHEELSGDVFWPVSLKEDRRLGSGTNPNILLRWGIVLGFLLTPTYKSWLYEQGNRGQTTINPNPSILFCGRVTLGFLGHPGVQVPV